MSRAGTWHGKRKAYEEISQLRRQTAKPCRWAANPLIDRLVQKDIGSKRHRCGDVENIY